MKRRDFLKTAAGAIYAQAAIQRREVSIGKKRVTLIALPLKMIGVEASPIRAVVVEE